MSRLSAMMMAFAPPGPWSLTVKCGLNLPGFPARKH
jgi:hypothetical protein